MIKPAIKSLKTTHYGKKIYEKLLNNYGEHFHTRNKINKNITFTKN